MFALRPNLIALILPPKPQQPKEDQNGEGYQAIGQSKVHGASLSQARNPTRRGDEGYTIPTPTEAASGLEGPDAADHGLAALRAQSSGAAFAGARAAPHVANIEVHS